jgi:hypothetical protein
MNPATTSENLSVRHLTEDELDEVLMGIGSPAASAHLAFCDPCGERLSAFETQMTQFNQTSMAWAAQRSNSIRRDLTAHKPTWRLTLHTIRTSTAVLAVVLAFAATTTINRRAATLDAATPSIGQTSAERSPAAQPDQQYEIASDNAMLEAIDTEIDTPQPSQFGLYETAKYPVATAASRAR